MHHVLLKHGTSGDFALAERDAFEDTNTVLLTDRRALLQRQADGSRIEVPLSRSDLAPSHLEEHEVVRHQGSLLVRIGDELFTAELPDPIRMVVVRSWGRAVYGGGIRARQAIEI